MNYIVYYIIITFIFLLVISLSILCAYKTVLAPNDSVAIDLGSNGDLQLDDICEPYLKLTNLGDVQVP